MSEEEYDVKNFLNFCKTKNFNSTHLFVYENRVLFIMLGLETGNLLVYVQSKFPIYVKEGLSDFIPITYVKEEDDDTKTDMFYKIKRSFDTNKQHFQSNCIKVAYVNQNAICMINRHNDIETFALETNVKYNQIFWVIDMENFYIRIDTLTKDLKNVSLSFLNTLQTKFEAKKNSTLNYLKSKVRELEMLSVSNFSSYEKRLDTINKNISSIKDENRRREAYNDYRDLTSSIENFLFVELLKWDLFFNSISEIDN
jgi:hypothetical protein